MYYRPFFLTFLKDNVNAQEWLETARNGAYKDYADLFNLYDGSQLVRLSKEDFISIIACRAGERANAVGICLYYDVQELKEQHLKGAHLPLMILFSSLYPIGTKAGVTLPSSARCLVVHHQLMSSSLWLPMSATTSLLMVLTLLI
jgi:hypothetical protein